MVSFVKIRMEICSLELEACRPRPCAQPLLRSGGRLEWGISKADFNSFKKFACRMGR